MASFAGLRLGSRGSSLRPFSLCSCHSSCNSALDSSRTHLGRAPPHFLLLTAAPFSSSLSTSSPSASLALSSSSSAVLKESRSGKLELSEDGTAPSPRDRPLARKFPLLSPKEKKDLRAFAHSLGKKIVSQQVGKAGVTESLANAISDALEAKEILKVLDNCPDELDEVIAKIEEATQGQVVGKIGSVLTIYRPSLRKLSEAQKSQNKAAQGRPRRTMSSGRRV